MARSLAHDFFEAIRSAPDPIEVIRSLSNSDPPTFETDWRDFKQEPQPAELKNPKWRDVWAEALGGFANNQGGVVIWGLDARKDKGTNIDAAGDPKPVTNPFAVKSRLIELQRQATDPPLANVEIEAYELPNAKGTGFVVCYIPEGKHKPYRTEDGRRSQYFIRAGDNFVTMSRSMLATMFYPWTEASFRVVANLEFRSPHERVLSGETVCDITCRLELWNEGTATAKDVFLQITWRVPGNDHSFRGTVTKWRAAGRVFSGTYPQPIHPGQREHVAVGACKIPHNQAVTHTLTGGAKPYFDVVIFSENQQEQHARLSFGLNSSTPDRQ